MTDDVGTGCLVYRTPLGSCPFKENIEKNSERNEALEKGDDCDIGLPKITKECATEEQKSDVQRQW